LVSAKPVPTLDWKYFQMIAERNVFNPSRSGRVTYSNRKNPARIDSFSLLGTMSYEKGRFAFFGGSASAYRKTLKPEDTIAGYKIAEIASQYVRLTGPNGEPIELRVGMQMKREDRGPWTLSGTPTASFATPEAGTPSAEESGGSGTEKSESSLSAPPNEILKRLMQKREQEMKNK
jgi:hypothetical protein